jgi:hypothetical protein
LRVSESVFSSAFRGGKGILAGVGGGIAALFGALFRRGKDPAT